MQVRADKRFGQHFLTSPRVLSGILRLADLRPDDVVLEIGAGTGIMTAALGEWVAQVVALELDRTLIPLLRQRFADKSHIDIVHADALTFDLAQLPTPFKVVANLPYGTAVAILTRLFSQRSRIHSAVVMLQREVAERLYASVGSKAYGSLTLLAQWYASVEKGFHVPPAAFSPPPKVMSTVLRLVPRATPPLSVPDENWLFHVIQAGFAHRRKSLGNALRYAWPRLDPQLLRRTLEDSGIAPIRRGETLSLEEFAHLAEVLQHLSPENSA